MVGFLCSTTTEAKAWHVATASLAARSRTERELGEIHLLIVCEKEVYLRVTFSLLKGNLYIPRKSMSKLLCHL